MKTVLWGSQSEHRQIPSQSEEEECSCALQKFPLNILDARCSERYNPLPLIESQGRDPPAVVIPVNGPYLILLAIVLTGVLEITKTPSLKL